MTSGVLVYLHDPVSQLIIFLNGLHALCRGHAKVIQDWGYGREGSPTNPRETINIAHPFRYVTIPIAEELLGSVEVVSQVCKHFDYIED